MEYIGLIIFLNAIKLNILTLIRRMEVKKIYHGVRKSDAIIFLEDQLIAPVIGRWIFIIRDFLVWESDTIKRRDHQHEKHH